jgi:hypothetical protein
MIEAERKAVLDDFIIQKCATTYFNSGYRTTKRSHSIGYNLLPDADSEMATGSVVAIGAAIRPRPRLL